MPKMLCLFISLLCFKLNQMYSKAKEQQQWKPNKYSQENARISQTHLKHEEKEEEKNPLAIIRRTNASENRTGQFQIWRINKSNNNGKWEHTKKGKYTNIVGCLVLSLRASKRCIVLEQHAVCMESVQWRQITNQFLIYISFLFFCWSVVCSCRRCVFFFLLGFPFALALFHAVPKAVQQIWCMF